MNGKSNNREVNNGGLLVSVIVPVYNVAPYLTRCVQSIVDQTHRNLEIWLVDDGSTDGGGDLCDEWAGRDGRIRVIHQPNAGLSAARNAALHRISGTLVTMVDSDDLLTPRCVQTLLQAMQATGADIAVGAHRDFTDESDIRTAKPSGRLRCYTAHDALRRIFYQHHLTHSAWGRLYKTSLFSNLDYPEGMLYEDLAVIYPLLRRARRVAVTNEVVYHYRQRPTSILGTFNPRREDVLNILHDLERTVAAEQPDLLPAVRSRLLSASFNMLLLSPSTTDYQSLHNRCWANIRRLRGACFTDRRVRLKNKLGILASLLGRRTFLTLFKH